MIELWDREKQSPHVLVKLDYVLLLQDLPSGVLLSQIAYWARPSKSGKSKMAIYKEGVQWIVKTREEWCEETGISLNQYKRAHGMLVERGLIESTVIKFQGRPVTAVRLQESVLLSALKKMDSTQSDWLESTPSGLAGKQPIEWLQSSHSSNTENTEETTTETTGESQDPTPMKASDVLANFNTLTTGKPTGVNSLVLLWKKASNPNGEFAKQPTLQEIGQLKHLMKALGSPNATADLITWALTNWSKFSSEAAASAGVKPALSPSIGYLLKHHAVAVQLIAQLDKAKAKPPLTKTAQKPTVIVESAPTSGENAGHDEGTASADDILALMNKLSNQPPQDKE